MSIRSKLFASLSALALSCFVIAGCASSNYAPSLGEPTVKPPTIGEAGTLRVGVNTSNQPLAGMGSDKIIGIDVDIAAALADDLGLKLSVVDVGSNPQSALQNNSVDIVMGIDASQTYNGVWLSENYLPTGIALFSMDENAELPTPATSPKFAAQTNSMSAQAVMNEFGSNALTQTQTLADAFADLEAGTVDFVAADAIIGDYSAHTENIDAHIIGLLKSPSGYKIGVAQSNGILRDTIADEVKKLVDEGIVDVIELKWTGGTISLKGLPQTPGTPLVQPTTNPDGTTATTDGTQTGEAGAGAVGNASSGTSSSNSSSSSNS